MMKTKVSKTKTKTKTKTKKIDNTTNKAQSIFDRLKSLEAKGINVINFAFGTPGFETPKIVQEAIIEALKMGMRSPAAYDGEHDLKLVICDYIDRTRGFKPKLEQILIGPEAKTIFSLLLLTLIKPGDEVISTNPSIPTISRLTTHLGGKIRFVERLEKQNFKINMNKLQKLPNKKTKAIILTTPHNPTGNVLTSSEVQQVFEIAEKNKINIISDETFSQIIFDGHHNSPAILDKAKNKSIIIENLSYTFSLTGWQLSYCVAPEPVIKKLKSIIIDTIPPVPTFIQYATLEAINNYDKLVPGIVNKYKKCSEVMINGLNELEGFSCAQPAGAIYAFPEISGTGKSSAHLAEFLLENAGVAVLPGDIFGKLGEDHIRLSFATPIENINEGLTRLHEIF